MKSPRELTTAATAILEELETWSPNHDDRLALLNLVSILLAHQYLAQYGVKDF